MLSGWKDLAAHVSRIAGYEVSADALRKAADRDTDLARIIGETVTGKPLASEYELERWVAMKRLPRVPRLRRIAMALIECGQMALL